MHWLMNHARFLINSCILGNLMVMVSFKMDKQLQTISNYFLFSLAVADACVGSVSIPLWVYFAATRYWGLGYEICQVWLCVDYTMSNASVLNLLVISFDRYFSVTRPLSYRPQRTTRKALMVIAFTYVFSAIMWPGFIIAYPYIEGKFSAEPGRCVVQFLETSAFVTVLTAGVAFYLPVTILIILYGRVYVETQHRQKEFKKLQANTYRSTNQQTRDFQSNSSCSFKDKRYASLRKGNLLSFLKNSEEPDIICEKKINSCCFGGCFSKNKNIMSSEVSENLGQKEDETSVTLSYAGGASPPETKSNFIDGSRSVPNASPEGEICVLNTYTVLIELADGENKRPSVKLGKCTRNIPQISNSSSATKCIIQKVETSLNVISENSIDQGSGAQRSKSTNFPNRLAANGFHSSLKLSKSMDTHKNNEPKECTTMICPNNDIEKKKSDKERRKNEKRQESKAAKTLSAILIAFIVTWLPYNVIVVSEAFFPNSINEIYFTISYMLCYINSFVNPLLYAWCHPGLA
uniref:G_PROTEIN_RECEP_F1_2 domain-containing protein n=1 Tax=Rhabditophanes sp. KR3021 TaxID=114890 RepID=A0AC35UHB3_9BILA